MNKDYPKKRWLRFDDISIEGNKTKIFNIENKVTGDILGDIKWDCGWRQYIFDDGEIKLAEGCLYELWERIKQLREEREKKGISPKIQ